MLFLSIKQSLKLIVHTKQKEKQIKINKPDSSSLILNLVKFLPKAKKTNPCESEIGISTNLFMMKREFSEGGDSERVDKTFGSTFFAEGRGSRGGKRRSKGGRGSRGGRRGSKGGGNRARVVWVCHRRKGKQRRKKEIEGWG